MKPVTIEFTCFGPYMERQFVDFTELERSGLFLICGETGAGKTTILDAICVALYGRTSGGSRGELADMRCKLAEKGDTTQVDFVFDNGGRRYRFLRSLRIARTNENEEHQCMEYIGGEWKPLLANAKKSAVNAKAEQIIGLTYDQFRQVIILPQGQFERLLTSKSEEKEEILTKLFHAERWERAVQKIYDKVTEQDAALRLEAEKIASKLKEFECADLEELERKQRESAERLADLGKQAENAKAAVDEQKKLQKQALLDNQEFIDLAQREKKLSGLVELSASIEDEETLLGKADEAERLRSLHDAFVRARDALESAKSKAAAAQVSLNEAAEHADAARREKQAHEASRADYDADKARLVLYKNAKELYTTLKEKKRLCGEAEVRWQGKVNAVEAADGSFKKADEAWQEALERQSAAVKAYQLGQAKYLQGIGGILAQKLVQGEPCPVCGSREHPSPAKTAEGHITDSELDALSQAVDWVNEAERAARKSRSDAEQAKTLADAALADAASELAAAKADCESAEAGKLAGIETSEELDEKIAAVSEAIEDFERAEISISSAFQAAQTAEKLATVEAERLQNELESAQNAETGASSAWEQALRASTFSDEARFAASCMERSEREQRMKKCAEFRTELNSAKAAVDEKHAALEGKTAPDIAAIEASSQKAEEALRNIQTDAALEKNSLDNIQSTLRDLKARKQDHDTQRSIADNNMEFAKRLRGSAGISLQRYVLGVRFAAVTVEANRLLETVYGGRYRLYRTDEASGRAHKKGLELEVYDTAQNRRRSVNTLSGGEKFLVSLSLAIGLSAVVRSGGGVHMEAMFVDEGFGSLDEKAVDDAVSILQGISKGSGAIVGVISHVGRLKEIIPAKLEVQKGKNGSCIYVRS